MLAPSAVRQAQRCLPHLRGAQDRTEFRVRKLECNALCVTNVTPQLDFAMPPSKTATLNLRVDPLLKEVVRVAAERQNRSIANLIEVLIREHCAREGIPIPEQGEMFKDIDRG